MCHHYCRLHLLLVFIISYTCSSEICRKSKDCDYIFTREVSGCIQYEGVVVCSRRNSSENITICEPLWNANISKFIVDPFVHYRTIEQTGIKIKPKAHKARTTYRPSPETKYVAHDSLSTDLVIDLRCNFFWPHVYFHKYADCLLGIMPALINYFRIYPLATFNGSITLLVDDSTEFICANDSITNVLHTDNSACFFNDFKVMIRSFSTFNCVNTRGPDHYKRLTYPRIVTDSYIFLKVQKLPFQFDNTICLREFRELYLHEYCKYCFHDSSEFESMFTTSHNATAKLHHNTILVIQRPPDASRRIIQHEQLIHVLLKSFPDHHVVVYHGNETLCSTIQKFHQAKVIIGAHGSGLVNTLFSRYNSLVIEITFSRVDGKPGHWRSNIYKAVEIGLVAHVFILKNEPGVTDRDLQFRKNFNLSAENITSIVGVIHRYLLADVSWGISSEYMRSSQYFYDHFLLS